MESAYDEAFDVKHDTTRKEKQSTIMAALHAVPKKIADTSQTQGVSEQFISKGIPSGIINPSMISHDRYLSAVDAIQDAIFLTLTIAIFPLFPLNVFTGTLYFIIISYWIFHIGWWEKSKIWSLKSSVKRYLNNTYRFYWSLFFLLMIPIAVGAWYFIFSISVENIAFGTANSVLSLVAGTEKAIASVFGNIEFVKNNFSINANYAIKMTNEIYETRFSIAAVIFFISTIASKIFFMQLYAKEKRHNEEQSKESMQFTGETALEAIREIRNA